jgi:hypothetical protein
MLRLAWSKNNAKSIENLASPRRPLAAFRTHSISSPPAYAYQCFPKESRKMFFLQYNTTGGYD